MKIASWNIVLFVLRDGSQLCVAVSAGHEDFFGLLRKGREMGDWGGLAEEKFMQFSTLRIGILWAVGPEFINQGMHV